MNEKITILWNPDASFMELHSNLSIVDFTSSRRRVKKKEKPTRKPPSAAAARGFDCKQTTIRWTLNTLPLHVIVRSEYLSDLSMLLKLSVRAHARRDSLLRIELGQVSAWFRAGARRDGAKRDGSHAEFVCEVFART